MILAGISLATMSLAASTLFIDNNKMFAIKGEPKTHEVTLITIVTYHG